MRLVLNFTLQSRYIPTRNDAYIWIRQLSISIKIEKHAVDKSLEYRQTKYFNNYDKQGAVPLFA